MTRRTEKVIIERVTARAALSRQERRSRSGRVQWYINATKYVANGESSGYAEHQAVKANNGHVPVIHNASGGVVQQVGHAVLRSA